MIQKHLPKLISIVVAVFILLVIFPMIYLGYEKLTSKSPDKCKELGGEYSSEFAGTAYCYAVRDGKLVDLFDE